MTAASRFSRHRRSAILAEDVVTHVWNMRDRRATRIDFHAERAEALRAVGLAA
jgi:hypothetical protein